MKIPPTRIVFEPLVSFYALYTPFSFYHPVRAGSTTFCVSIDTEHRVLKRVFPSSFAFHYYLFIFFFFFFTFFIFENSRGIVHWKDNVKEATRREDGVGRDTIRSRYYK